jgi:hypothetical protein
MVLMARFGGIKGLLIPVTLLALFLQAGCSRPFGAPADGGTTQTTQTPFHDEGSTSATSSERDSSGTTEDAGSENNLPFHPAQSLPVGTLLMVRLKAPISTEKRGLGNSFEAALDTPVIIAGNTLIPRGAVVTGRVESAHTSRIPGRGYLELALQTVHVAGGNLPVQTASLFVRPSPQKDISPPPIRLEKGRRLTFRLTQPIYPPAQTAQSIR